MTFEEKEIKNQKILSITVSVLVTFLPLTSFINDVFNRLVGSGFIYDSAVCYLILWYLLARSLLIVIKDIKKDVLFFTFLFYAIWKITYNFCPDNRLYMMSYSSDFATSPFYILFVCAFSGYIFTRYLTDCELFENIFFKFATAVIICSTISFFITLSKDYQKQYMVFSYNMLVNVVFLIVYFFEYKKPIYLAIGLWGFILMFMAGCRGAIVCCAGSLMVYLLFHKTTSTKKIALVSLMSIFLYIIIVNLQDVVTWIADMANNLNIDSRTIKLIESGAFFDESGRDYIREQIISEFNMFGHGIFGDRVLGRGSYAHNFIIEIIAQFGYIPGTLILGAVFILIGRGLFSNDKTLRNLIIIFLSVGFFKLFFSSSYLSQEPGFYVLIGLCVNAVKQSKLIDKT